MRLLRLFHRWAGLVLALPLLAIAASGLFMMAEPFVSSAAETVPANGPLSRPYDLRETDIGAVLALARAEAAGLVPVRLRPLSDGRVAVDLAVPGRFQPAVRVSVDAALGRVASVRRNPDGLYRWVHSVHETLLLGPAGRAIVGWSGVLLFLLALAGIPIWWPPRRRWRSGFTISRRASGYRFQRELHGATGIWWIALLLLQSLSGVTLAFPQTVRAMTGVAMPGVAMPGVGAAPRVTQAAGLSDADPFQAMAAGAAAALAAVPGATLEDLRRPAAPGRPMTALMLPAGQWAGSPAARVTLDPATARILSLQTPDRNSVLDATLGWLRAIHEGGAGGPAGRAVMCVFGLCLGVLPVTGAAMWLLRRRLLRRAGPARAAAGRRPLQIRGKLECRSDR